jgi:iron complex outermembrane recepter protein
MCGRAGIILSAIFASTLSLNVSTSLASSTSPAGAEIKSRFDLPAEPLDKALRDFAVQANCNISYEPSIVAGLQAPAIKGEFTVGGVLSIMLTGTRLRAVNVNEDTIQILEKAPSTTRDATSAPNTYYPHAVGDVRVADAGPDAPATTNASSGSPAIDSFKSDAERHGNGDLQEITVTGTHIHGTKDSPSPVQIYNREDIDATGMNTVQQFLQTLPQNFGSASENTIGAVAGNGQTNNTVNGSAPNLRGLGADATLVLINSHRVAPGNSDGSFVDISMIPLTAIERIEIVTDGASAIYGSDAVGGVVNIILRKHYDGTETRAQFGSVSSGSMHNVQVGQTVGDDWTSGSALLSYQYSDQTPLSAASRDYLQSVVLPFTLIPEQVQHAAFANVDQDINADFSVHGDAAYSHRSTYSAFSSGDLTYGDISTVVPAKIDGYSATLGLTVQLARQSVLGVTATYSESDTSQQSFQTPSPSPLQFVVKTKSAITSVDVNLDGVLASIPAGSIRYAIGAQYRKETFGNTYLFPATDNTFYPRRNVDAGYVEVHLPVAGQSRSSHGDPTLELTLADRGERYSDFGSTNNPQVGVLWRPLSGTTIRGTYGTSFKAPLLSQLNPIPSQVVPIPGPLFNPAPGGTPNTLVVYGGNPDLKPEKAKVWTVGLDLKPVQIPGFSAKLTYYDIVFTSQIAVAGASFCACNAFNDASILGTSILHRNPPASLVQQLISFPTYSNPFDVDPTTIGAIFDSRAQNLSSVKTRGLDFGLGYKTSVLDTRIDTGIDGTYIFAFDDQFTGTAPITPILDTTYNPVDLRLRGRAIATRGPLSAGVYVNFTNAYADNNVTPNGRVSSWTTADAVVSYQFGSAETPFSGTLVQLSVVNLTDRDPPYVTNISGYPITYDGANANALGRYFSVRLQKRW